MVIFITISCISVNIAKRHLMMVENWGDIYQKRIKAIVVSNNLILKKIIKFSLTE